MPSIEIRATIHSTLDGKAVSTLKLCHRTPYGGSDAGCATKSPRPPNIRRPALLRRRPGLFVLLPQLLLQKRRYRFISLYFFGLLFFFHIMLRPSKWRALPRRILGANVGTGSDQHFHRLNRTRTDRMMHQWLPLPSENLRPTNPSWDEPGKRWPHAGKSTSARSGPRDLYRISVETGGAFGSWLAAFAVEVEAA